MTTKYPGAKWRPIKHNFTDRKRTRTSAVFPHMRIASNSHSVGPLHSDRSPVNPALIAGGGARNESIRPLPIDPEGPWL